MPVRIESSSANLRPLPQTNGSITVKPGDTLSKLAQRAGVSVEALVQANVSKYPSLATNRNAIQVGWSMQVPGGTTPPPPAQTSTNAGWQNTGGTTSTQATGTTTRPNDVGAKMAAGGAQSIAMRTQKHLDAIEKTGVGTYFGDHSSWKTMSADEKTAWIAANTKDGVTPPSPASIKEASCIGWVFENVGAAYAAAGKSERWSQIMKTVVANGSKGTDLAKELKKDGWQSVYWNPDAKNPNDGNPEHSFSASQVAKGKGYYGIAVDAQVINYRPTDDAKTKQDLSGIEKLKEVPFFFGLAKGGMHTFVGRAGEVNEFHWAEMPNSQNAIEQTPLKDWGWNSGLIMVPPGTWPKGN